MNDSAWKTSNAWQRAQSYVRIGVFLLLWLDVFAAEEVERDGEHFGHLGEAAAGDDVHRLGVVPDLLSVELDQQIL